MESQIHYFLNNNKVPKRIDEAKSFARFARELAQIEVRYASLPSSSKDEMETAFAFIEMYEGNERLLRMEIEELHYNPSEKDLVTRCETLELDSGTGVHIPVPGLIRANEIMLSPLAEEVSNPKKEAIAYLLHQVVFNCGGFTSWIVKEQIMRAMPENWQDIWRDRWNFRILVFGEDTYWRANDPSDPVLP